MNFVFYATNLQKIKFKIFFIIDYKIIIIENEQKN